ncbi:hypothetical protein HN018_10895 [Lichenicola cladoniae]|uniref:Uncharacterized protein n=1 Tax=Lichenicola cladoniae TaxID=1484109 RepID=A0A6M8HQC8_9PROT|nr:hypothetical protein [Lichenicola cladoniae]NPD67874.1 hypothetical protein [Acetobacteraceae bacterium]QKE90475.1 hypothetical protein HN018_10895 [Lichenicola cladoniae]
MSLAILAASGPVRADETDIGRVQLDKVLSVLRVQTDAAGKACLSAMANVHESEQQVKAHTNDNGAHPDLDIAKDVLESDYQNGAQICGADAARACRTGSTGEMAGPCKALQGNGPAPSQR